MKCIVLFVLLCFYSSAEAQQVSPYAVFCFAERNFAGNYVVFLTSNLADAQGCCLGGSGSAAIFANVNYDSTDTVVYAAANCPPQEQYYPLTCYRGNTQCQATGTVFNTQAIGEAAVQECCGATGTMASFNLAQIGTVCITCVYPALTQSQLNQARAMVSPYVVFCFAERNFAGNYVAFLTSNLADAQGCCLGGSGSAAIFANVNYDNTDTVVYAAVNCPPQEQYYPLTCYRGNTQCQATGTVFNTQAVGEAAVQECCGSRETMASFHLAQIGTICITCVYPSPTQSQLNQARAMVNASPHSYSQANVCVLAGLTSLAYLLGKIYNE